MSSMTDWISDAAAAVVGVAGAGVGAGGCAGAGGVAAALDTVGCGGDCCVKTKN